LDKKNPGEKIGLKYKQYFIEKEKAEQI